MGFRESLSDECEDKSSGFSNDHLFVLLCFDSSSGYGSAYTSIVCVGRAGGLSDEGDMEFEQYIGDASFITKVSIMAVDSPATAARPKVLCSIVQAWTKISVRVI